MTGQEAKGNDDRQVTRKSRGHTAALAPGSSVVHQEAPLSLLPSTGLDPRDEARGSSRDLTHQTVPTV